MKIKFLNLILALLLGNIIYAQENDFEKILKPRIVILTDVSPWETDDQESLVRLLAYANMLEIEGIIYTTGWSHEEIPDQYIDIIYNVVDAYEKDLPNLKRRSNQKKYDSNENKQYIGYWPSADYLRKRIFYGSRKRGLQFIGESNDSPGSDYIISLADENDERPLWILLWGGGNTIAQSIWKVRNERSNDDLSIFLNKISIYAITDQDRSYKPNTPFNISCQQWLRKEFEKELLFLWDESAWLYQNETGRNKWREYEENIQNHGELGKEYPKYKFGVEGDTPAFLHVLPNGLNNPMSPNQVGWGGYFEWGAGPDTITNSYNNHNGQAKKISGKYEEYFYPIIFNDFSARMDWAKNGKGNLNPVVIINNQEGINPVEIDVRQEHELILDATNSYDPDNDELNYKWWYLKEAGSYKKSINIINTEGKIAKIILPPDIAIGDDIHIICEITDNGTPNLSGFRRIIITKTE